MKRELALDQLQQQKAPWDFIIVGGGATGLGTAVDAVALNRVADATIQRLVSDITARLSAEATLLGGSAHRNAPRDHGSASVGA